VPALMLAAWIAWLARTPASRRWSAATVVAAMLATLATAVAAFGFVPLAVAWVQDRPLDTGPRVAHAVALWTAASIAVGGAATTLLDARGTGAPPRALWALAAVGVATIFAALAYAAGARGAPALVACIAAGLTAGSVVTTRGESPLFRHAAVAATLALASWCAALSRPPRIVTLAPGATSTFAEPGRSWSLVGQGTSTDEGPTFDGAIVAVEVRAPDGDSRVVAAGERLYRQAHGHGAERGVLPAVDRGVLGDLRLTVEAVRADTVAFRVRAHPLVTLAWASSLALVLLLGAAAFTGAAHGNE